MLRMQGLALNQADFVNVLGFKLEVLAIHPANLAEGLPKSPLVFLHADLGSVTMWRDWPMRLLAMERRWPLERG